jgi:hypothetical protein
MLTRRRRGRTAPRAPHLVARSGLLAQHHPIDVVATIGKIRAKYPRRRRQHTALAVPHPPLPPHRRTSGSPPPSPALSWPPAAGAEGEGRRRRILPPLPTSRPPTPAISLLYVHPELRRPPRAPILCKMDVRVQHGVCAGMSHRGTAMARRRVRRGTILRSAARLAAPPTPRASSAGLDLWRGTAGSGCTGPGGGACGAR